MNMPRSVKPGKSSSVPLSRLSDDEVLEAVQRRTFRYFWEGAHPVSFMARDRSFRAGDPEDDKVAVGGTGFGVMAIIVAVASVLTIADAPDFARRGGMIAFTLEDSKVRFIVNQEAAEQASLNISSRLLALATIVRTSR